MTRSNLASLRMWVCLAASLQLPGCGPSREGTPAIRTARTAPVLPIASDPPQRISGAIGSQAAVPPTQLSIAPPATPGVDGRASPAPAGGDIVLDFVDTDIREVAAQILGNLLRLNYTVDAAVRGTATLRTATPLSRGQLLPVLQTLLAQNGASLVQDGAVYRVLPSARATGSGATVVPLRYAAADDLARVLQPFISGGGSLIADPGRNALIVSGDPIVTDTLQRLIASFDVNLLAGQSYALFPVATGDARDFAQALQEAFRAQAGGSLGGVVRIVPMQRINAVLVVSPQSRYIEDIRRTFTLVERARRQTVRGWHVYYLQNSRSNDTAYVLQQAFTPRNVTAQPTLRETGGALGPGRQSRQLSGGGLRSATLGQGQVGGGRQGQLDGRGMAGASAGGLLGAEPGQVARTVEANPLLGGLDPSETAGTPDDMRIISSPQNNALLIYGTRQELDTVEATLRKLDILPLQVRIDATIAEVTLNDTLRYGTQFFFKSGGLNGALSFGSATTFASGFPGFVLNAQNGDVAISALQAVTEVNVLSSPQLLVMDNETARLQVGNIIPYLTQSAQSTFAPGAPVVNSVDYRETGVIMEVTPRVNSGGLVILDIVQEVSDVDPAGPTTPGINSPTFQERSVRSRVVVQDGQTIGLAGLIRDSASRGNSGLPWLKDIPLLGVLAGRQDNTRARTELIVLITPYVIQNQRDARMLTDDLQDALPNAAAVPGRVGILRPSGSSDPGIEVRRRLRLPP